MDEPIVTHVNIVPSVSFESDQLMLSELFGTAVIVHFKEFIVDTEEVGQLKGLGVIFSSRRSKRHHTFTVGCLRLPLVEVEDYGKLWDIVVKGMVTLKHMLPEDEDGIMYTTATRALLCHIEEDVMELAIDTPLAGLKYIPPHEEVTEINSLYLALMLTALEGMKIDATTEVHEKFTKHDTAAILAAEQKRLKRAAKFTKNLNTGVTP